MPQAASHAALKKKKNKKEKLSCICFLIIKEAKILWKSM